MLRLILVLIICKSIFCLEYVKNRPVIYTRDGNLNVEVPSGKQMNFIVPNDGRLYLNKRDLTEIIDQAHTSLESMQQCRINSKTAMEKLTVIEHRLDGSQGLLSRVMILEKMTNNSLSSGQTYVRFLRRKVTLLQKKLNTLINTLEINECSKYPCKNGGTCHDLYKSYRCICPENWEGGNCDVDVDECKKFAGTELGCQNGATCVNKIGTYECQCANGWYGPQCTSATMQCTGSSDLCGHGTCIPQGNSYKCLCDQGWKTDGIKPACTVDVNECQSYHPPCSSNPPVSCINLPGSFYCGHCPPGYTGNGFFCNDINECEIMNGGCSMIPLVQCVNTPGSRICGLCPPGYLGNGITCTYQGGVCGVNNGGCHHLAQCRDNSAISASYVECICPQGYSGNGLGPNGCQPGARNACLPNPCVHGTCSLNGLNGYTCSCTSKYTGTNCNIRKNACESNPCQNGGTCINIHLSFMCLCPPNLMGNYCQLPRQTCGSLSGASGSVRYPPEGVDFSETKQISCAWKIKVAPTKAVQVTFTSVYLPQCSHNFLQIHDGRDTTYPLIGRFCEGKLKNNTSLNSTTDQLYLWFRGNGKTDKPHIEMSWKTIDPICGGNIFANESGTFKSPGSPNNYPPNRNCYWKLAAPEGKRIKFTFYHLDLGNNADCTKDTLNFYDGIDGDKQFFTQCKTELPEPIYSPSNEVQVHLKTVESHSGFLIHYSLIDGISGCGGIYTLSKGLIRSPDNLQNIDSNAICQYKILLPSRARLKIEFLMWKQMANAGPNCENYHIALYHGDSNDRSLIKKYCSSDKPTEVMTFASEVLIIYKNNWRSPGSFLISYSIVCGGTYVARSGNLVSPKLLSDQALPVHCVFKIIRPENAFISLKVNEFNLNKIQDNTNCNKGYLQIQDVEYENSTVMGKFCDRPPDEDAFSSSNSLLITFYTTDIAGSGLFLSYDSKTNEGCGGVLRTTLGTVKSPDNLESFTSGTNCTWVLRAPPDHVIQITWVRFNLEISYKCAFDYVRIIDNSTTPGNVIGNYCGNTLPPNMVTTSNLITVLFKVDPVYNMDGFMFTYRYIHERNICGGQYFSPAGVVKSPQYPGYYPPHSNCEWVITVKHGEQIMLNVTFFEIEKYYNCRYDYLQIRNGGTSASPLIGKYCGQEIPKTIYSHTNQIYLQFVSDRYHSAKGFYITWSSAATGCGGALSSPMGTIISPNYPEPYSKNTECFWKIDISAGSLVQLVFADLDLESHSKCFLDYVEIFDVKSKSLGRYCSTRSGQVPVIKSSSNHVTVKFHSDLSYQGRGFQLQYSTLCKTNTTGFRGVIESPNFPNGYPHDLDCLWRIEVPQGNTINLTFSHFELQRSLPSADNKCKFVDYLQIQYENIDNRDEMIEEGTYCSPNKPDKMSIKSNVAQIKFVSDGSLIGMGFRLEWALNGCGGILKRPSGTITSPNYPKPYPVNTICEWLIQTDLGRSIEITFQKVDMEIHQDCEYDYVEVYNGMDETAPKIAKFCNLIDKPNVITSVSPNVFIRFVSDITSLGRGFTADYKTLNSKCGGTISGRSGSIHSPNYPKNYDKNDSCYWLIEITENHVIELTFEDWDFLSSCQINHVKIYDGPTAAYPLLDTLCGTKKNSTTYTSKTNHLYIEMVTHNFITTKGFMAKYKTACGAIIKTQSSGLITYTSNHRISTDDDICSWTIISERPDEHIYLTFTSLQTNTYCGYLGVSVYDGEDSNATLVGTYCEQLPSRIKSGGSTIHIVSQYHFQFNASYSVLDSACGGVIEFKTGLISTPNYPENYPLDTQCEWILKVSPGNIITFTFSEFDIAHSESCNEDYLEMRENNANGKLLGVYCGENAPTNITINTTLWMYFKSEKPGNGDNSDTGKGFLMDYTLVHGNELYGESGQISSPGYPNSFAIMERVTWKITVKTGRHIQIHFLDFFIGFSLPTDMCYRGYFTIFDGPDDSAEVLGDYCGEEIPPNLITSSNVAYITFSAMNTEPVPKFLLEWKEISKVEKAFNELTKCDGPDLVQLDVGGRFNLSATFSASLKSCSWSFFAAPGRHLKIVFNHVSMTNLYGCALSDKIRIFSSNSTSIEAKTIDHFVPDHVVCNSTSVGKQIESGESMVLKFNKIFGSEAIFTYRHNVTTAFSAIIYDACGGTIHNEGMIIFNSTTDVVEKGNVLNCVWKLTARNGRKIKLQFLNVILDNKGECATNVQVFNGHSVSAPSMGKLQYCKGPISELVSTGTIAMVKFRANSQNNTLTIRVSEQYGDCGGKITLSKEYSAENISSPNYPNAPDPFVECIWQISAPNGEAIRIDFLERFDLIASSPCNLEYVEVRDGATESSQLIGQFCTSLPSSQTSLENMMFVKYYTSSNNPRNGFKAQVSIAKCGGIIRDSDGTIKSPNFMIKNNYPLNADCKWEIETSKGQVVKLTFDKIDLPYQIWLGSGEARTNCTATDSVRITEIDPFSQNETTLGVFCGAKQIPPVISTRRNVFVYFKTSNKKKLYNGFSLSFTTQKQLCGETMETATGEIISPGYPSKTLFSRCEWKIKVAAGRRIKLTFEDLDFSPGEQGVICFKSEDVAAEVFFMSRNANVTVPHVVRSSDNIMTVYYWSSGPENRRGFKAIYTSDEPEACGGELTDSSSTLENPSDESYICQWRIQSQLKKVETYSFEITMTYEEPPNATSCLFYAASILILSTHDRSRLAELCKNTVEPIIIRTVYPSTKVLARQKGKKPRMTFKINYKKNNCGGMRTDVEGFILPNGESECAWKLIGVPGDSFTITAVNFNIPDCSKSYIEIFNGPSSKSPKIGRFCGDKKLTIFKSQDHFVWIEYHGSSSANFNLSYSRTAQSCGGILNNGNSLNKIISTPNYPAYYDNNVECLWEIRAKNGYYIQLSFVGRFQVENSRNCENDYVAVYEKPELESKASKFCGRQLPGMYNSSSNSLYLLFRSNEQVTGTGFKAAWTWSCGGVFNATEETQYIESPGYPEKYGPNLNCTYTIKAPGKFVSIEFLDFDLENIYNNICKYDKVKFHNLRMGTRSTYCGTSKPPPIWMQNAVTFELQTDNWVFGRGFRLSYKIRSCGGIINTPQVLNFVLQPEMLYKTSIYCKWNITAPKDKRINIQFLHVNMSSNTCYNNHISVFDTGLKAEICGIITDPNELPKIAITTNKANVVFFASTAFMTSSLGFSAMVEFTYGPEAGCGGVINAKTNEVTKTFNVPGPNYDCIWRIFSSTSQVIEISFIKDNNGPKCTNDCCINYRLLDGNLTKSEEIFNECDILSTGGSYFSSSNVMQLRIRGSEAKYVPYKFEIKAKPDICGTRSLTPTSTPQYITSPNYPNAYPANVRCVWKIRTSSMNKILVKFVDFNMNSNQKNIRNCGQLDRLEIVDKDNKAFHLEYDMIWKKKPSPFLLARFNTLYGTHTFCSANDRDYEYISPNDHIQLSFFSNNLAKFGNGFKLEYQIATCNRNYTALQGTIAKVWHNANCSMYITVPKGFTISLFFSGYDLFFGDCSRRAVEIFDGDESKERLMKMCHGTITKPVFSKTNQLFIRLHSSLTHTFKAYTIDMTYTSNNSTYGRGCGGNFYTFKGSFTSPLYPEPLSKYAICDWNIKVPMGLQVALIFTFFDIEGDCEDNYVKVWEKSSSDADATTYCSKETPATFISTGSTINVKYATSARNTGTGWTAKFLAITSDLDFDSLSGAEVNKTAFRALRL